MGKAESSDKKRTVSLQIEDMQLANKAVQALLAWQNMCSIADELGNNLIDEGGQIDNFYLYATFKVKINDRLGYKFTIVVAKSAPSKLTIDEDGIMTIECEYNNLDNNGQPDDWGFTDVEGSFTYITDQSVIIRVTDEIQQVSMNTCTVPHY